MSLHLISFEIIAAISVAIAAFALYIAFRTKAALRNDRTRLLHALKRIEEGDYSDQTDTDCSQSSPEVKDVYSRTIPQIRQNIETLEWRAQHDTLTDLLNVASFKAACQEYLAQNDKDARNDALIFFDINDFKKINDSLGHKAGDQFLRTCADRLRMAASNFETQDSQGDTKGCDSTVFAPIIGRLGGDEFGVFLPGQGTREDVDRFLVRLRRLVAEPCQIGAHSLRAKISAGVSFSTDHHAYDKLLAAADTAMYEAKAEGGGGHRFYDVTMQNRADQILAYEMELREAIQRNEFTLYFQPQINLATRQIESAEALIRWNHKTRGIVGPDEFIPFAEKYDLIDEIGDWVVQEAIKCAAKWRSLGHEISVSINVSPKQLGRIELIPLIRAYLKRYKLPSGALELEITEAAIMNNEEFAIERLEGLRRDGVSLALDDFGIGYSNIAQLLALPLDRLKLDRSLLESSLATRRRRLVFLAIVQLSRKAGFKVVAEGVQTESQLAFLETAKCQYAQGFIFARPLPEAEFLKLVSDPQGMPEPAAA